ncbi:hypothetical protein [Bradyrhizobium sp. USDA 4486]
MKESATGAALFLPALIYGFERCGRAIKDLGAFGEHKVAVSQGFKVGPGNWVLGNCRGELLPV